MQRTLDRSPIFARLGERLAPALRSDIVSRSLTRIRIALAPPAHASSRFEADQPILLVDLADREVDVDELLVDFGQNCVFVTSRPDVVGLHRAGLAYEFVPPTADRADRLSMWRHAYGARVVDAVDE